MARGAPAPNPLLNPSSPLSGKSLLQAAQSLTNAQVNGPLAQLAAQIKQTTRQGQGAQKLTNQYFQGLGNFANQSTNQVGQIGQGLNSQLQQIGQNTQHTLGSLGQQQQQSMLAHAPQGDGGLSTQAQSALAAEIGRQQGLAAQDSGAFQNFGATQGANNQSLAAQNLGTYGLMGQERLGQIAQAAQLANRGPLAQMAALRAQRGSLLATNEGKLRQQEISNALAEEGIKAGLTKAQIAATQSGLNATTAATQSGLNNAASNNQSNINNRRSTSTSRANSQRTNTRLTNQAVNMAAAKGPQLTPTGQKVLTPVEQQRIFDQIGEVQALIKDGQAHGLAGKLLAQQLASGNNPKKFAFPQGIIDSAFALQGYGYLTPAQIAELNKMGVIVGNRYRRGNAPQPNAQGLIPGFLSGSAGP